MPFNGSGSFNTVYNWQTDAANGLDISSSRMQGQDQDFASGLSICMTKDGQQVATNNLPMGGFTLTNLSNASAQKQPVSVQDFQNGTPTWVGTVTGTDTITAAANISPLAYAVGQTWRGIIAGANLTDAVTMNFNSLGAVPVIKNGVAIAIGEFAEGQVFEVTYDGTSMQLGNIGNVLTATQLTINDAVSEGSLVIDGTNNTTFGPGIILQGPGATTPNKTIFAFSGSLYVANSARTSTILQLDDSGNLTVAGNTTSTSDERLKIDWIDLPTDVIERFAGVLSGTFTHIGSGERMVGVGAQSLRDVLPEAVSEDAGGLLSVAYGQAALAICKELAREIVRLRALLEPVK